MNNSLLIVFDSCRYDSSLAARPKILRKLGRIERRWPYASWTAPSHYNLLMGLMPHFNPKRIYASEYYKTAFLTPGPWILWLACIASLTTWLLTPRSA